MQNNNKLKVSTGWIKTQAVGKFAKNQDVLARIDGKLKIGKIEEVSDSTGWITVYHGGSEKTLGKKEDLLRLVVTDGERFAPLQHEDWEKAIADDLVDSDKNVKYFIIERHSKNGSSLIKLARIFKPKNEERDRQIAEDAYRAGQSTQEILFEEYWEIAKVNLYESH